jgi:hypothetical protein
MRATETRAAGLRHLFAAYDLGQDKLFGHIKPRVTGPGSWNSAVTCALFARLRSGSIEAQLTAPRRFALDGTDQRQLQGIGRHDPPVHHLA